MHITWFAEFHAGGATQTELEAAADLVAATPGLAAARLYTACLTDDPTPDDGPPPPVAMQLDFADIANLEAALGRDGHLRDLPACLPGLAEATQQAMLARPFPVRDPQLRTRPGRLPCTHLATYQGTAGDLNAWLAHYLAHQPLILARLPGVRAITVCTRLDWTGFLPFRRVAHMQRNQVVFDHADALHAALNSPVRHEIRTDFRHFPAFTGPTRTCQMHTRLIVPAVAEAAARSPAPTG